MTLNVSRLANYMGAGFNILLTGPAGTGKTQTLREAAASLNLKMKYFSASTMDPFLDLVGVPVTEHDDRGKYIELIRQRGIEDAEVIFFDEINRAGELKTQNGIFELVQEGKINGIPLPNLKCVVAAMNPADDEDYVGTQALDYALLDRFDTYIESSPEADLAYFINVFGELRGEALVKWHQNHDAKDGYISPRRMEKIGKAWDLFPNRDTIIEMMPPGGKYNAAGLYQLLRKADTLANQQANGDIPFIHAISSMPAKEILARKSEIDEIVNTLKNEADLSAAERTIDASDRAVFIEAVCSAMPDKVESIFPDWGDFVLLLSTREELALTSALARDDFRMYAEKKKAYSKAF